MDYMVVWQHVISSFLFLHLQEHLFFPEGDCLTPSSDVFVQPGVILSRETSTYSAGPHTGSEDMPFPSPPAPATHEFLAGFGMVKLGQQKCFQEKLKKQVCT